MGVENACLTTTKKFMMESGNMTREKEKVLLKLKCTPTVADLKTIYIMEKVNLSSQSMMISSKGIMIEPTLETMTWESVNKQLW